MQTRAKVITLVWPRTDYSKYGPGKLIVASGRTDMSIVSVRGTCQPVSGPGEAIICTTIGFHLRGGNGQQPLFQRWMIAFRVPRELPDDGRFVFTVTGLNARAEETSESVEFIVNPSFSATITYPTTDDDITDEKDDLVAYGDLLAHPLGSLVFEDADLNEIVPIHQTSDYQFLQLWSAEYPPLEPSTYMLHVEDVTSDGDTAMNITVSGVQIRRLAGD